MDDFIHLIKRLLDTERLSEEDRELAFKVGKGLARRVKDKKVPNTDWYRAVQRRETEETIGYYVGRGVRMSSWLSGDMVPHGTKI